MKPYNLMVVPPHVKRAFKSQNIEMSELLASLEKKDLESIKTIADKVSHRDIADMLDATSLILREFSLENKLENIGTLFTAIDAIGSIVSGSSAIYMNSIFIPKDIRQELLSCEDVDALHKKTPLFYLVITDGTIVVSLTELGEQLLVLRPKHFRRVLLANFINLESEVYGADFNKYSQFISDFIQILPLTL